MAEQRDGALASGGQDSGPPRPGLVVVYSDTAPRFVPLPLADGRLSLSRDLLARAGIDDLTLSRLHLVVTRRGDAWHLHEVDANDGYRVDGVPRRGAVDVLRPQVLRVGRTVLIACDDVGPALTHGLQVHAGVVVGPRLAVIHQRIRRLAEAGQGLMILGDSGAGKEIAARIYHDATGRPHGPFVAINCATIPAELAESLLFGARRGAYSGAVQSADGYVQAADGGTLFLDEIGELDARVQAKLLRVLETREVLPLGDTRARAVDLRLCAATSRDLQGCVRAGSFREDLFYRIARPCVRVPALHERREELPWLIEVAVRAAVRDRPLLLSPGLIEACLLRAWPGNVRELSTEIQCAAIEALAEGRGELDAEHLDAGAGARVSARAPADMTTADLRALLRELRGNVSRAAQRLGIPRSTLRRMIARAGITADDAR